MTRRSLLTLAAAIAIAWGITFALAGPPWDEPRGEHPGAHWPGWHVDSPEG